MLGLSFFVTSMLLLSLAFISLASPSETEPKLGTDTPHPFGDPSLYEHTLSLPPAIPNREFDISPPEQPAANHDPSVVAHLLGGSPRPIDTHTPVNHPGLSVEPTVKEYVSTFVLVRNCILLGLYSSDPGPHPCHPEFVPTASGRYVPTVPPRLSIHMCVETKWAVAWGRLRLDGRMGNLCITIEDNKPVGISLELLVETYQEILHRCWRRYVHFGVSNTDRLLTFMQKKVCRYVPATWASRSHPRGKLTSS